MLSEREFLLIREFTVNKAQDLLRHESDVKSYGSVGLPYRNHYEIVVENRRFIIIAKDVFFEIVHSVLIEASEKYPHLFGQNKAELVVEAIYNIYHDFNIEYFTEFLKNNQFAWIVELKNDIVADKILRIELFRQIKPQKDSPEKTEFIGGIFHAFKHFSYNGVPLSYNKEINNFDHPTEIFEYIIKAFFFENHEEEIINNKIYCISKTNLNERYDLRFVFYFEPATKIFFINSIRKDTVSKKTQSVKRI